MPADAMPLPAHPPAPVPASALTSTIAPTDTRAGARANLRLSLSQTKASMHSFAVHARFSSDYRRRGRKRSHNCHRKRQPSALFIPLLLHYPRFLALQLHLQPLLQPSAQGRIQSPCGGDSRTQRVQQPVRRSPRDIRTS